MRSLKAIAMSAAILATGAVGGRAADVATGSGILIAASGEILTNAHVVEACRSIKVTYMDGSALPGTLIARDQENDLALLRTRRPPTVAVAVFREGPPLRTGDDIVVLGYPLAGVLASGANLTVGNVSALAGMRDDTRYIQISAPVQPGNSGGPLVDSSGHLIGIVTSKLDAVRVARLIGDIPQNVNFALKAQVARTFLESKQISYKTDKSTAHLSAADVGAMVRPFTVHVACIKSEQREAAATPASAPAPGSGRASQPDAPGSGLKGALRDALVTKTLRSCTRKTHKANPDVSLDTIRDYCLCMAEAQADTTTESDVAYIREHHEASQNYKDRIAKAAAVCKKKVAAR